MLITLYGPDSYRKREKLHELVFSYKSKGKGADVMAFDLNESPDSWEEALDFLKQPSMFANSKLAIIRGAGQIERKDWIDALKSYKNSKDVFVIVLEEKKPTRKLSFLLKEPAKSQQFEELGGEKLSKFLTKKLKELGIQLSPRAKRFFLAFLCSGRDRSWRLVGELSKVSLAGFGNVVEEDDLKKIIGWRSAEEMFSITRKILDLRDERAKLSFLEQLISRGEEPHHIFNMLGYQSRGKESEKLAEYDISIKSGGLGYEEALVDFALENSATSTS